jgi:sortase A
MRRLGTIFIFAGVALLAVLGTRLVINEALAERKLAAQAQEIPLVVGEANLEGSQGKAQGLAEGEIFAKLYVPRFGDDYVRNIAQGTSLSKVLNTVGIGHYEGTQLPGEVGNFAIAGHRAGNGGPMRKIDQLVEGDLAYVETATTRYTYRFIDSKVVSPEDVGVINAQPEGLSRLSSKGQYLTMTTCTPIFVNTDRYIAWFELVGEAKKLVQE